MTDVPQWLIVEEDRFKEKLPALLERFRDKWVVFKDGEVVYASDDMDDAYRVGVKRFGSRGEWVFRQVIESQTWYGTNGVYYGTFTM
jgi:hypothetical protein